MYIGNVVVCCIIWMVVGTIPLLIAEYTAITERTGWSIFWFGVAFAYIAVTVKILFFR